MDSWDILDGVVEKNIDLSDLEPTLDESDLKQSIQEKILSFFQREYSRLPENNKFRAKVLKYYAQNEVFVRKDSTIYSKKIKHIVAKEGRKEEKRTIFRERGLALTGADLRRIGIRSTSRLKSYYGLTDEEAEIVFARKEE